MGLTVKQRLLRMLIGFVLGSLVITFWLEQGYRIGIDRQVIFGEDRCLDEFLFLIRMRVDHLPKTGDYIVTGMPKTDFKVGAKAGTQVIKLVAATHGDHIQVKGTDLFINGQLKDRLWLAKSIPGKKPGDFDVDIKLEKDEYFLMGTTKESFDSRYWGKVHVETIRGFAYPII